MPIENHRCSIIAVNVIFVRIRAGARAASTLLARSRECVIWSLFNHQRAPHFLKYALPCDTYQTTSSIRNIRCSKIAMYV
jgi:hypothetical protein